MLPLLLLVVTAVTFCIAAGMLLWKEWQRKDPQRARRFARRLSGLRFSPLALLSRTAVPPKDANAWQIRWGDSPSPDIELSRAALPRKHQLCEIPIRVGAKQPISDFVLSVTQVLGAGGSSPFLKMFFSPELASHLRSGQLDIIRRTIGQKPLAFDPTSGTLREIPGIAGAVNALAAIEVAWEVEAYVTAKKFLPDIRKCLQFIAAHLPEIRDLLLEQREAEMNADYHYLLQISTSAELGSLSPEDTAVAGRQLETLEQRMSATSRLAEVQLQRRMAELHQSHDPDYWNPDDLTLAIKFEVSHFVQLSWLVLLTLQTRGAALYVRAALPMNKDGVASRLSELSQVHARLRKIQDQMLEKIGSSVGSIQQICERQHKSDEHTARVQALIKEAETRISTASKTVEATFARLRTVLNAGTVAKPLEVFATIEGANVTLAVATVPEA